MHAPNHYAIGVQQISDALIRFGYVTLDAQAKALGINRSTAWTIVKTKHKIGRLNTNTISRILANPETPPVVRAVVQQYLAQRSDALRRASVQSR